jgi:hypothetical protein
MKILRYVGDIRAHPAVYMSGLADQSIAKIDLVSQAANVAVRFLIGTKQVQVNLSPISRDFLDFAICVYIADEILRRSEGTDGWSRSYEFLFPVQDREIWEEVEKDLVSTISYLSGDRFSVSWLDSPRLTHYGRHRHTMPDEFDAVCLFSGGLDSLIGSYQLLNQGKRLLLVGHYSDSITSHAQKRLASFLRQGFAGSFELVQCGISRSRKWLPDFPLPEKMDCSHRPRSVVFLALAVALAGCVKTREIYIPENGLIGLNIPLQLSRIGSLSTRTTHPIFLSSFVRIVSRMGLFSGRLCNPFLYDSKTQLMRRVDDHLRSIVRESVSCAHPGVYTGARKGGRNHCGYCVPCIYRRIALMDVGEDRPGDDYQHDVFSDLPDLSATKSADLRALVQFAKRIVNMSKAELEAAVLSQGYFPANIGGTIGPHSVDNYGVWSQMVYEWSVDFLSKINRVCCNGTRRLLGV